MEASALQAPVGLARGRLSIGTSLLRLRSDEQLVALFRAGHEDAFRVIHDRYRERLFAFTRQMLSSSRQDAEDALQDIFVRAYAGLRASDRQLALRAWLYRIAHNRCIDELRRPVPPPADVLELLRAPAKDPLAEAEQRESLRRLLTDVQRLPEQQRSALLMRELGGMAYSDVAGALDVSVPAVKSLLVRARVSLTQASEARDTACTQIREQLMLAHDRGVRPDGMARRHMRDCSGCREFRGEIRGVSRQLAALAPLGPLGLLGNLLGIGGASAGGAAAAGGAGSAAAGGAAGAGGAVAAGGGVAAAGGAGAALSVGALGAGHVAAVLAAAVVAAGGALELSHTIASHHRGHLTPAPLSSTAARPASDLASSYRDGEPGAFPAGRDVSTRAGRASSTAGGSHPAGRGAAATGTSTTPGGGAAPGGLGTGTTPGATTPPPPPPTTIVTPGTSSGGGPSTPSGTVAGGGTPTTPEPPTTIVAPAGTSAGSSGSGSSGSGSSGSSSGSGSTGSSQGATTPTTTTPSAGGGGSS